jgi:hypothetical protein
VESIIAQSHSAEQKDDLKHLLLDLSVALSDTERDVLQSAGYDAIERDAEEIRYVNDRVHEFVCLLLLFFF